MDLLGLSLCNIEISLIESFMYDKYNKKHTERGQKPFHTTVCMYVCIYIYIYIYIYTCIYVNRFVSLLLSSVYVMQTHLFKFNSNKAILKHSYFGRLTFGTSFML